MTKIEFKGQIDKKVIGTFNYQSIITIEGLVIEPTDVPGYFSSILINRLISFSKGFSYPFMVKFGKIVIDNSFIEFYK